MQLIRAENFSWGFPGGSDGEEPACNAGDPGSIPGSGRSLAEGNGYPFQYSHKSKAVWQKCLDFFHLLFGEGNGNPLQCSCLENPRDGGARWAAIYGVTQSRTQMKRFSSSSSSFPLCFYDMSTNFDLDSQMLPCRTMTRKWVIDREAVGIHLYWR